MDFFFLSFGFFVLKKIGLYSGPGWPPPQGSTTGAPAAMRAVLLELVKTGSAVWVVWVARVLVIGCPVHRARLWSCTILITHVVASLSLAFHSQRCPAPHSALKTTCSETRVPNLSGGRSRKRSSTAHHKTDHPASSKNGSVASPLPEANRKTPEHQDACGSVPLQVFVPAGHQTLSRFSEDLSLPPQPPPLPPPPPPPPPLPLPTLSSFQATTHQNLGLRTLATEAQPLSLACEAAAERPCDCLDSFQRTGNSLRSCSCSLWVLMLLKSQFQFRIFFKILLSQNTPHLLLWYYSYCDCCEIEFDMLTSLKTYLCICWLYSVTPLSC